MKKNIFGSYLRNLREHHGLKQSTLAEQLDISGSFINFIEQGKRLPGKSTLKKLSIFFNVDLNHLRDLLQKQKLLNNETTNEPGAIEIPEQIKKLSTLLQKVDKPLLEGLVSNFIEQVNEHLIKMTANYSLSSLRNELKKELTFDVSQENVRIEGYLKLPENNQLFFRLTRLKNLLILELLQNDRDKIGLFEKWMGPHVYTNLCEVMVPQVTEIQRGVSFTWFSPNMTLEEQRKYLLTQKETKIDSIYFNDARLAWHVQLYKDKIDAV